MSNSCLLFTLSSLLPHGSLGFFQILHITAMASIHMIQMQNSRFNLFGFFLIERNLHHKDEVYEETTHTEHS